MFLKRPPPKKKKKKFRRHHAHSRLRPIKAARELFGMGGRTYITGGVLFLAPTNLTNDKMTTTWSLIQYKYAVLPVQEIPLWR